MSSPLIERFPFELAIADAKLLKPRWDTLTRPQQVILKAFYGLPLGEEELVYWSILQGGATYDDLGYVTSVTQVPYVPKEYSKLVAVLGRRSGKTDMVVATATAYEITLGGHKQYVRPGQEFKAVFFAQSKGDAEKNMNFIKLALEESPLLKNEIREAIATEIRLKNGLIVDPMPVGKSVGRGHAIPVVICDEAAFWYTDPNAANPDYEVLRAVSYAQLQFPHAKIFVPSTPWAEQGILWESFKAGTEGRKLQCDACKRKANFICEHPVGDRDKFTNTLVVHSTTAAMQSLEAVFKGDKALARKRLIEIRRDDPEAFPRESNALFIKSVSGWLNSKKIEQAIDPGTYQREALKDGRVNYVACIDPAFRKDSFAMTIGHHDAKLGIVQDFIRYWEPQPGEPLNPGVVLDEIKVHLDHFGISTVYSDQYQLESLQQLALDRKFTINGYDFTGTSKAKICGSFKVVLDNNRLRLLEHEVQKTQLEKLQRQVLQAGHIRIAAPPGQHDDLAMVLILMARMVMWLVGEESKSEEKPKTIDKDHVKMAMECIERKRREAAMLLEDE
jgi:hypothetical protein